jgi:citrate lyase subunit beta/citryl-CoA lyase
MTAYPPYDVVAARLARATTFLFVPGNRSDRFERAWRSKADVVILDLEASVHPGSKATARAEVARWLRAAPTGATPLVRINRLGTEDATQDWHELSGVQGTGLMCSGAEAGAPLEELLAQARGSHPAVLLVETAIGIEQANQLAALQGVCRMAFGNMDYATELGLGPDHWGFVYPGSRLVVASKCAGLPAPVAGVTANIHDRQAMDADMSFERGLGFTAKMCIHPTQVPWARQAFEPTSDEVAWAQRILKATADSHAIQLEGQMIDRPVIERARRILRRSETPPETPQQSSSTQSIT